MEQESYTVDEGGSGTVEVCAILTGRAERNITVTLATEDGSAEGGSEGIYPD